MIGLEQLRGWARLVAILAAQHSFHVYVIAADRAGGVFRNTDTVYPVFSRPTDRESVTNVSAVTTCTTI